MHLESPFKRSLKPPLGYVPGLWLLLLYYYVICVVASFQYSKPAHRDRRLLQFSESLREVLSLRAEAAASTPEPPLFRLCGYHVEAGQ